MARAHDRVRRFYGNCRALHRDDFQHHPNVGENASGSVCNFIECLGYRVRRGDNELEDYLKTCSENVSYISKTSHKELIYCCGKLIKDVLIKDIKESFFFFNFSR